MEFAIDFGAEIIGALDEQTQATIDYAANPARWIREQAGFHAWSKQVEVIEALRDHRRVAVHSAHSTGKTKIASAAVGWWIDAHPPGEAFVLTSAPTGPQVKALLWREINRLHAQAGLDGRTNLTEWYINHQGNDELVAFGRKPSEYSEAAFQGFHAKYVLVVLDEASGIPEALWNAAESVASNRHARILAIGNPDLPTGPFADACAENSPYHVIHIGFQHTPAATGEDVPEELHDVLISAEWAEDRREAWGEESALFQAKVLGQFPTGDADPWRVIPETEAAECRFIDDADPIGAVRIGGIDVGGGDDRTVIVERVGASVGRIASFTERDPMLSIGVLADYIETWGLERVRIDVVGIGWAVAGRLREVIDERGLSCAVQNVNFAAKASNPKRFLNVRAEAWWNGRDLTRSRAWSLARLDTDAIAELTMPRYEIVDSSGKIKIEPKDDVRARLGRSPDIADAVLLAFYDRKEPRATTDARQTFAGADLTGARGASSVFGGPGIPGLPMGIPRSLDTQTARTGRFGPRISD